MKYFLPVFVSLLLSTLFTLGVSRVQSSHFYGLLGIIAKTHRDTERDLYLKNQKALVLVKSYEIDGLFLGTGWYTKTTHNRDVIITNAHVCGSGTKITYSEENNTQEFPAFVLKLGSTESADICVLVYTKKSEASLSISTESPDVGDRTYVVGHPLGGLLQPSAGVYLGTRSYANSTFLALSNLVYPGNSGSPVLNSDNEVLGMATISNGATATAVPASIIIDFIKDL